MQIIKMSQTKKVPTPEARRGGGVMGRVTFSVRVVLGGLSTRQHRPTLRAWSSANRTDTQTAVHAHTGNAIVTLSLDEHHSHAEANAAAEAAAVGNNDASLAVWFELMAEEASTVGNRAVLGHCGTGGVNVQSLLAQFIDKDKGTLTKEVLVPLTLYNYTNERGAKGDVNLTPRNSAYIKSALVIRDVTFERAADVLRAHAANALFAQRVSVFSVTGESSAFTNGVVETCVERLLYQQTPAAAKEGVSIEGVTPLATRLIVPYRSTSVGLVWGASYFIDEHASERAAYMRRNVEEAFMARLARDAFKRQNMDVQHAIGVMRAQLARRDDVYDARFTECVATTVRAMRDVSVALVYQSDFVDAEHRVQRLNFMASAAGSSAPRWSRAVVAEAFCRAGITAERTAGGKKDVTHVTHADVESYDDARMRGGGDCEDLGRLALFLGMALYYGREDMASTEHVHRAYGGWNDELLDCMQAVVHLYVPGQNVAAVTSPALKPTPKKSTEAAALAYSAAQWAYPRIAHHYPALLAEAAATAADKKKKSKGDEHNAHMPVIDSAEARAEVQGGHMFGMWLLKTAVSEWTRRVTEPPESVEPEEHSVRVRREFHRMLMHDAPSVQVDASTGVCAAPGWYAYLPTSLTLEGTGRLHPLMLPAVAYQVSRDRREKTAAKAAAETETLHWLLEKAPALRAADVEGTQTAATQSLGAPRHLTAFYRQVTQFYTPLYYNETGIAGFDWYQTRQPVRAEVKEDDALYERSDVQLQAALVQQCAVAMAAATKDAAAAVNAARLEVGGMRTHLHTKAVARVLAQAADVRHDTEVHAEQLRFGVQYEDVLAQRPLAPHIALMPQPALDRVEARVMSEYLRHLPAFAPATFTPPSMRFAKPDAVVYARVSHDDFRAPDAKGTARLVCNADMRAALERRAAALMQGVTALKSDVVWPAAHEKAARGKTLLSFGFYLYDLVDDDTVRTLLTQLGAADVKQRVYAARAYEHEPTRYVRQVIVQLLCTKSA